MCTPLWQRVRASSDRLTQSPGATRVSPREHRVCYSRQCPFRMRLTFTIVVNFDYKFNLSHDRDQIREWCDGYQPPTIMLKSYPIGDRPANWTPNTTGPWPAAVASAVASLPPACSSNCGDRYDLGLSGTLRRCSAAGLLLCASFRRAFISRANCECKQKKMKQLFAHIPSGVRQTV